MRFVKIAARTLLGFALTFAGIGHLTTSRLEFQAQVPTWLPLDPDFVVVASGIVEITLGLSLIILFKFAPYVGLITALFFIAIFPGNISQLVTQTDAFGLNTDTARAVRLLFQPLLVVWSLWSTNAVSLLKRRRN
jgi:uncharacterized membrane protein